MLDFAEAEQSRGLGDVEFIAIRLECVAKSAYHDGVLGLLLLAFEQAPPVAQPTPAAAPDELSEERAKAERLARIVASDIVLYLPEKFSQAISQGNVVEAMDSEIEEARRFFRERVDERVREERDFIVEELLRVARAWGMQ